MKHDFLNDATSEINTEKAEDLEATADLEMPKKSNETISGNSKTLNVMSTATKRAKKVAEGRLKDKPDAHSSKKKTGRKKDHKIRKDIHIFNIVLTFVVIAINIFLIFVLRNSNQFSSLSTSIFTKLNIIVLIALLLLDGIVAAAIKTRVIYIYIIACVLLTAVLGAGGYGQYVLSRVNNSMSNLTDTDTETNVTTSFVIYNKASDSIIVEESDLNGKTVGYATGTSTAALGQKRLENDEISVYYKEYNGYQDLFTALINGDVDCAILPQAYANLFGSDEALMAYVEDTTSILDFTDSVATSTVESSGKDMTKEPFTVLITGENEGLADTIILVSVNPVSMKVTMTSIARDSYVPITCYNNAESKINAAHAVSEACMVDTVTQLTGVDIDYTAEFTFISVIQVVDAVGGVDVYNDTDFVGQSWDVETDSLKNVTMPYDTTGAKVHMNGEEALAFVRERYAFIDGDFARQRHQQEVIEEIVNKVMESGNPNMLLDILDAAGDNMTTNISSEQMISFMSYAMKKAKRYYNQGSIAGIFNIQSSHIAGYSSTIYDASLGLDLWIYRLYNGSIQDTYNAIERNLNLYSQITTPDSVNWSAKGTTEVPAISLDYYDESLVYDTSSYDQSYNYTNDYTETYIEPATAEETVETPAEVYVEPESPSEEESVVEEQQTMEDTIE